MPIFTKFFRLFRRAKFLVVSGCGHTCQQARDNVQKEVDQKALLGWEAISIGGSGAGSHSMEHAAAGVAPVEHCVYLLMRR